MSLDLSDNPIDDGVVTLPCWNNIESIKLYNTNIDWSNESVVKKILGSEIPFIYFGNPSNYEGVGLKGWKGSILSIAFNKVSLSDSFFSRPTSLEVNSTKTNITFYNNELLSDLSVSADLHIGDRETHMGDSLTLNFKADSFYINRLILRNYKFAKIIGKTKLVGHRFSFYNLGLDISDWDGSIICKAISLDDGCSDDKFLGRIKADILYIMYDQDTSRIINTLRLKNPEIIVNPKQKLQGHFLKY